MAGAARGDDGPGGGTPPASAAPEPRPVPADPEFEARVRDIFGHAPFIDHLGIRLTGVGAGWCTAELAVEPRHLQQDGYVHAGVQATLADHTAGGAGGSLIARDRIVLSVGFELHLLRPARGERLACRARVLKPGRNLIVAESEVTAHRGDRATLVSKATVTLAVVAV